MNDVTLLQHIQRIVDESLKKAFEFSNQSQPNQDGELLTENEVSRKLNVSKVTLKKWRDEKRIPFLRLGTRIRYRLNDVLQAAAIGKIYARTS